MLLILYQLALPAARRWWHAIVGQSHAIIRAPDNALAERFPLRRRRRCHFPNRQTFGRRAISATAWAIRTERSPVALTMSPERQPARRWTAPSIAARRSNTLAAHIDDDVDVDAAFVAE
jgi:hypothetical protein